MRAILQPQSIAGNQVIGAALPLPVVRCLPSDQFQPRHTVGTVRPLSVNTRRPTDFKRCVL